MHRSAYQVGQDAVLFDGGHAALGIHPIPGEFGTRHRMQPMPDGMLGELLFFAKPSLEGCLLELWLSLDRRASSSATRADNRLTYAINGNNMQIISSFCSWLRNCK